MKALKATIATLGFLVALGAAGYGIADHLFNSEIKARFDRQLASLRDKVDITYDRFHYNLLTGKGEARGITATTADGQFRALVDRLVLHRIDRAADDDTVTGMRVSGHGVRLREKLLGKDEYRPAFTGLGYSDPRLEFLFDYAWDEATQTLIIRESSATGPGLGQAAFDAHLSGLGSVNAGRLSTGDLLQLAAAIGNLRFHGASLDYSDAGLVEKMLVRRQTDEGLTRAQIIEDNARSMREQQFFRFPEAMIDEVSAFLAEPGRLTVVSAPNQPVGRELIGMTLLFRGNLLQVFGVSITNGAKG